MTIVDTSPAARSAHANPATPTGRAEWAEARRIAHSISVERPPERVELKDAIGRVLVGDLTALTDVPHYASSAMDGWAVAGAPPWRIMLPRPSLTGGEATAIHTGGLLPAGARAVLPSEDAAVSDDGTSLRLRSGVAAPADGRHIRPIGEEARRGEAVIAAGTVLNPAHIAVAAVCGHDRVELAYRPRVRLVLTGDEVVTDGLPGPGQVRDSFGPQLPRLIELMGARVEGAVRVADRLDDVVDALRSDVRHGETAAPCDLIVTTGGTGHSDADQIRPALEASGAHVVVDGIAMRPGGPCMIAVLPSGPTLIALPGNPLAAMSALLTVLPPLIAGVQSAAMPQLGRVRSAKTTDDRRGRTRLVPFVLTEDGASDAGWHGAAMLRGLARADGLLVVPPEGIRAGESAEFVPLPWAVALG